MAVNQPYDEKKLLAQVAMDDTWAFQELLRVYKDATYTAALRIMQNRERAEDCVQDVFMKIWLRRDSLPAIENFGAWLHTVTHNTLLSALKRLAREKLTMLPDNMDVPAGERTVEDLLAQKEQANLLNAAIATLTGRQRQVYQLVKKEGYSREEAARNLGISLDTVKFHLTEATRKIRTYIIEHGDIALLVLLIVKKY